MCRCIRALDHQIVWTTDSKYLMVTRGHASEILTLEVSEGLPTRKQMGTARFKPVSVAPGGLHVLARSNETAAWQRSYLLLTLPAPVSPSCIAGVGI